MNETSRYKLISITYFGFLLRDGFDGFLDSGVIFLTIGFFCFNLSGFLNDI